MKVNGDTFHNPPKNKSSNSPENSSCTTNLIKCSENFLSSSKDSKEPGSTCTQCNITFSDFQSKVNHTCMPYKCKICNTAFSFDFKLKMHKCNKRKSDKTEANKISPADSASSLSAELPDNENVPKKISKNCCRCGKKLSPRCNGILCRNCRSTTDKNKKSTVMCTNFSKSSPSSLSELLSNTSNSSETQDHIEACNQSTNILGESYDIITSSDVSDSNTLIPMSVDQKKMRISEEIPKKYDSSKKKYSVAFKKDSDVSSTTDKHDILSLNSQIKKKRRVGSQSKGRKKTFSNNAYSVTASKSVTFSPLNNQISDSGKLTADCKDKLGSNFGGCRSLKVFLTSILSENSVESNKDSASEICSDFARDNKLGNVPAENNITLSREVSSGQEFESIAVDEVGSLSISTKVKTPLNSESELHYIESRVSECSTSNDSIHNNVPETSKLQNSSSTGRNVFCKTRNNSIKKSKKLLSLEGKRVDTDNSRKHLECGRSQKKAHESNILIASLKNKRKASKRKFSSGMGYFKGRIYKGSPMKCRHKFSKKLGTITEESLTSLPSIQRNPKKVTFADFENCVTASDSRCNEASIKTSVKDYAGKGRKRIFPFKVTSEETLLTENPRIVSTDTYKSSENKKLQTDHSNSNSHKSAYSISDDPQQKRSESKEKEDNVSESISFGSLIKALPKNGIVLIKGSVNGRNIFKCPKCNYVYQQFQRATDHIRSCPFPKHKEKEPKLLSDFEYVCSLCYQRWTSVDRLYKHYKQNLCPVSSMPEKQSRKIANSSQKNTALSGKQNTSSISNYIDHYGKADKNHVCHRCNFSCLSLYTFNQHPCERRRELMTKCVVEVKKLTKIDLVPFPNITNFQCSYCQEIFYDEMVYQNHCKKHSNVNRNSERSRSCLTKEMENQIKNIISFSRNCDTVEEITERVIEPLSMLFSKIGSKDVQLNDVNLSGKQQKLFSEVIKSSLADKIQNMFTWKDITSALEEDLFSNDDSDCKDSITSEDQNDFACKCQKNIDPNIEAKPCLKCLNLYVTNKIKDDDTTQNAGNGTAVSSSSCEPIPSTSHSNSLTLTSSFSAAVPNSSDASNDSHLTEIPVSTEKSSAPSASAIDKSFIQTSGLGQNPLTSNSNYSSSVNAFSETIPNGSNALNKVPINNENSLPASSVSQLKANIDVSTENAIGHEIEEKWDHLGLSLPYLKVLCCVYGTSDLSFDDEIFCCTKLPPKIKNSFLAKYNPVTIYKGIPEVLNEIRLYSKSNKIVFFVDMESDTDLVDEKTTKGTSDIRKEKLAFLESLLDVSNLTTLKSPLILDTETLDSIHNQHLTEYSFPNLDKQSPLKNVKHLAYWDFDIVMNTCIFHNNKFTVKFQVFPDNVTVILHWNFDRKKDYDVYVSKAPIQYICAECLDDFPLSLLIKHVTDLHKNSVMNIYIL